MLETKYQQQKSKLARFNEEIFFIPFVLSIRKVLFNVNGQLRTSEVA